jgi:hypothetical protein
MERKDKIDRIWMLIGPSLRGYSVFIDRLLRILTEEQIDEVLAELEED